MTTLQAVLVVAIVAESLLLLRACRRDRYTFADHYGVPVALAALLAVGLFLITHGTTPNTVSAGDLVLGTAFGAAVFEALRK